MWSILSAVRNQGIARLEFLDIDGETEASCFWLSFVADIWRYFENQLLNMKKETVFVNELMNF